MSVILAIDAGGTAVKVAVYGLDGREAAVAGEVMAPAVSAPGWAERDTRSLWAVVRRCLGRVLLQARVGPEEIAVVGLTGYGNGLLLLDAAGEPIRPAILATDQRAASIVDDWRAAGLEGEHIGLTHQRLWPGKPLPLLAWLERHEPDVLARAAQGLTCKDYLRWRLTGRINIEVSDASTSSLLDHAGRSFTPVVLDLFGLGHLVRLFPPMLEPLCLAGTVTIEAARELGLREGTPVSAGYADGPAMLLGLGVTDQTRLNVVAGTWGLNQLLSRTPVTDGSILASTLGLRPGDYVLIDGAPTSASAFEWFVTTMHPSERDRASLYARYGKEVTALGRDRAPLYFLPYLGGRPDAPDARGVFFGLSGTHGLPDMARAVFEGVAMEHRTHVEALLRRQPRPQAVRFAGGAARSRRWLGIFAATLGLPNELGAAEELGALGAAIVAAVGAGLFPDVPSAVRDMTSVRETIEADAADVAAMNGRFEVFEALRAACRPLWPRLHAAKPGLRDGEQVA